jgi:hypothetical protein
MQAGDVQKAEEGGQVASTRFQLKGLGASGGFVPIRSYAGDSYILRNRLGAGRRYSKSFGRQHPRTVRMTLVSPPPYTR